MSKKQAQNDALKDRLSRYREINLSVTGRKSGRTISKPVWLVLDDDNVYLLRILPVILTRITGKTGYNGAISEFKKRFRLRYFGEAPCNSLL